MPPRGKKRNAGRTQPDVTSKAVATAREPTPAPPPGRSPDKPHPFWTKHRLEGLAERAAEFASGPWGTHVGFGLLAFWLGSALVIGWTEAYGIVDEVTTMSSFLLLFLLQRAQAKDGLAMQVKLNELLAAVQKASPTLINLEDKPESEVQEIHDRFQELQQRKDGCGSIEDVGRN